MKNPDFMKKVFYFFDMEPKEVDEIKNHLTTYGCTECSNKNIQILRWVPSTWYVNCSECNIIYKFDFVELKAERVDVSWDHLLKIVVTP